MSSLHERRPVVAGVDGSEPALDAVRWAAAEAVQRQVALRLVSALGTRAEYGYGPRRSWANIYDEVVGHTQHHLNIATAAATKAAPGIAVDARMRTGHPSTVLTKQASDAGLLVLGHRGWSGLPGLVAGSVAVRMAATAPCPVVVVAEPILPVPGERPVVLGVDGTELSEAAIDFAFAEANLWGSRLVAVHTWFDQLLDPALTPFLDWDAVRTEERALLAQRLAGWSAKYPDVAVRSVVLRDRPAHALLEQAADARLLVVGSRGRGVFTGSVLGSVSQAVLHRASCPVAVVRPEQGNA